MCIVLYVWFIACETLLPLSCDTHTHTYSQSRTNQSSEMRKIGKFGAKQAKHHQNEVRQGEK